MRSAHFKKILAWLLVLGTSASLAACGTGSDGAKKGIVISEVVSSNGKSYEHDYYGSPDWIELHNESDQPINLLGWGITDNIRNSDKAFTMPEIVLPADGYLLLLATKMEKTDTLAWDGESPICLGFSLKSAGEDLVLINPHMQTIDELAVPELHRDISYARRENGTYGYCESPTPGSANTTKISDRQPEVKEPEAPEPMTGVEISEISARNTLLSCGGCLKCDWVELHNTTNADIALDGFTLCDEPSDYDDANLSGVLPANGYLVVFCCDKNCSTKDGHVCVDLGVSRYGETLYLFDPNGFELETVVMPEIPYKDVTYARRADGTFGFCETPTPGAANTTEITDKAPYRPEETPEPDPDEPKDDEPVDPTLNAKRPDSLRISEALPKNTYSIADCEGERCDWVELYNSTDQAVSLRDWYLSDNPKNLKKWALPESMSLSGGQYLVIFLSGKTGIANELHASFSLGTGETLYLYNAQTGRLDWITVPELPDNVSIGLNEANEQVYYRYPTPGAPNGHGEKTAETIGFFQSDGVYISEVCAIHDRGSSEKDWIELYNGSQSTVSLDGWYLSDSLEEPQKYRISSLSLKANGYAVIEATASYGERKSSDAPFGVSPSGEKLYLSDANGIIRDIFETGVQQNGVTSGRVEGNNQISRVFFTTKTKGKKNSDSAYRGYASMPVFSENALYHTQSFDLSITSLSPNAQIYYTTNGSEPGKSSTLYSGPITISKNAVIRAIAYVDGMLPSEIVTFHYLFEEPHTVPVVCLAMDPTDFNTVYKVREHKNIKERKGYVNYYEPDGLIGTSFPCDVKAKGRGTLTYAQKSLTFGLRAEYGMKTVDYPFFPGYEFTEFGAFALRNAGQDYDMARMRDTFVTRACMGLNVDCANSRCCVLYINGTYYGVYDFNEELNSKYLATHYGVDPDTVNTIMRNGSIAMKGSNTEFKKIFKAQTLSSDSAYQSYTEKVDADAFMDYVICRTFMLETDTFNQKYWRTVDYKIKWRPILYDLDYCFMSKYDRDMMHVYFNKEGVAAAHGSLTKFYFTVSLKTNEEWKHRFFERYVEVVMTKFTSEKLLELFDQVVEEYRPEMERHIKRWGHPKSISKWESEVATLRNKVEKRPTVVLEQIRKELKISKDEMNALIAKYSNP
ncbi:MAG: lamin tail domain-containing protein [Clostridia bacterium]|nr:lamin tail domain-containing protein [Clostridia bacterium]